MANGKLTNEERLIKVETRLDDICDDIKDVKKNLENFINTADRKYASREEVAALKKLIWFILGATAGFLVWVLQQYVQHISI